MKFFITTPIYYVNDKPHVGHAYTTLAADIVARFHRFIGDEVFFLTGTDEHGAKIAEAAEKLGKTPQALTDDVSQQFRDVWDKLGITYDRFIRTTEEAHIETVNQFLVRLKERGFVHKGEYTGLYCKGCEEYKRTSDLINGKCPLHNIVPETLSEPAYFFKLSAFRTELTKIIASDEMRVMPNIRKNEVLSFLEGQALEDIAISRANVAWGIPVPWDESQTIYVWIDALINYYTAGKAADFWPPAWHLMSKDILRFHCVIWPAMLLALQEELPKNVFVHGFFTVDGQKMSKTLGNVVDPVILLENYSPDALRYFLFQTFPFGGDGDFSHTLLHDVYNSALSNELGNLVQRVIVMVQKYRGGTVPQIHERISNIETAIVADVWRKWEAALNEIQIDEAFKAVWELVKFANKRIDDTKPWDLAKTDDSQLDEVLYELLEMVRHIALMLTPLMPEVAQKIATMLNQEVRSTQLRAQFEQEIAWGKLKPGATIPVGAVLFPRKG